MILAIGSRFVVGRVSRVVRKKTQYASRNTQYGLTLIEVLLAVAILSIGIVGVIRAYGTSIDALQNSQYSIEVISLLKEKMVETEQEIIKHSGIRKGVLEGEFEDDYEGIEWEIRVSALDLDTEDLKEELRDYLNEVKITVVNEQVIPPRRFSLVTYAENK